MQKKLFFDFSIQMYDILNLSTITSIEVSGQQHNTNIASSSQQTSFNKTSILDK